MALDERQRNVHRQVSTSPRLEKGEGKLISHRPIQAFLGTGGPTPRFVVVNLSEQPWNVTSSGALSAGESVYVIAPHPEMDMFAVGTRNGSVRLLTRASSQNGQFPYEMREIHDGAPVLSLCWVSNSLLSAGDAESACFLWDIMSLENPPRVLETGSGDICALLARADLGLVGLSTEGELLIWNLPNGDLTTRRDAPAPPARSALVNLTFWAAAGAIVYPAAGGRLTIYELESGDIATLEAHEGDFYGVAELGDNLVTAGFNDRRLKVWAQADWSIIREATVPCGAISLAVVDMGRRLLLIVDDAGQASACALNGEGLERRYQFEGGDYRIVVGPASETLRQLERQRIQKEAASHLERLNQMLQYEQFGEFNALCNRLIEIGYGCEAHKMLVAKAVAQKDVIEELRARLSLSGFLSDGPESVTELKELANLLQRLQQYDKALVVYRRVWSLVEEGSFSERIEELSRCREAVANGKAVIEPGNDVVIEKLFEAADLLGNCFAGRIQLTGLAPKACPGVSLSPSVVLAQCEYAIKRTDQGNVPRPLMETLIWIGPTGMRPVPTLLFPNAVHEALQGLELAFRILTYEAKTTVEPFLLLNVDAFGPDGSAAQRHRRLREGYRSIMTNRSLAEAWRDDIVELVVHVLRRLLTRSAKSHYRKDI